VLQAVDGVGEALRVVSPTTSPNPPVVAQDARELGNPDRRFS